MNMRDQLARALYTRASEQDFAAFGYKRPPFEKWTDQATWFALADAALDALLQLPEKACLPLGEWGVGEEGKRAAALLTWNGFISVIRLIQKGTA